MGEPLSISLKESSLAGKIVNSVKCCSKLRCVATEKTRIPIISLPQNSKRTGLVNGGEKISIIPPLFAA